MNETFPSLSKYSAKGNVYRASLTRCIKIEPTATLLKKFRNDLKQIANKRNSIIHGTPPYRTPSVTSTGAEKPYRLKNDDVRYAIEIAFEVYKTVNTIRNRSE